MTSEARAIDFKVFKNQNGLATASDDEIQQEKDLREQSNNIFPLDVFHPSVKPMLIDLVEKYKLPRAYIGATLLSTYSTAIGSSYVCSWNGSDTTPLATWVGLTGISSSGKSLAINKIMAPLVDIQRSFSETYRNETSKLSDEKIRHERVRHVIIRDIVIATLVRYTLPDNVKGLVKRVDELVEWINGLNPMSKKDGTDEQFWLSSWNGGDYEMTRSGKLSYYVQRPFVNIIGGIQWDLMHKIFAKDRDSSGFAFRVLFAPAQLDEDKFLEFTRDASVPEHLKKIHSDSIGRLYHHNEVYSDEMDSPRKCILKPDAADRWIEWRNEIAREINFKKDRDERQKRSGIFGKISEYALRFAAIIHLADKSLDENYVTDFHSPYSFKIEEHISVDTMNRAIRLANYFYQSAIEIYDGVMERTVVKDPKVIGLAGMLMAGKTYRQIAYITLGRDDDAAKKKVERDVRKYLKMYPRVFRAQNMNL